MMLTSLLLLTAAALHPPGHTTGRSGAVRTAFRAQPVVSLEKPDQRSPSESSEEFPRSSLDLDKAEIREKLKEMRTGFDSLRSGDKLREFQETVNDPSAIFSQIEKAAQDAAGQTADDVARAAAAGTEPSIKGAQSLPDSFEDSIAKAVFATQEALEDGLYRIVLEFDTSAGDETYTLLSRTLQFFQPYLPALLDSGAVSCAASEDTEADAAAHTPRIQVLFPDEGTAAFVKQKWGLPSTITLTSIGRANLMPEADALVLINPGATEVQAVQRLLKQADELAPTTPFLMLNPKLISMQSTGYGECRPFSDDDVHAIRLVGRELRNLVATTFETAYCLRSFPGGALFRTFPGLYSVWREDAAAKGGYVPTYAGMRRPSGDEIDELLEPPSVAGDDSGGKGASNFLDGFSKFVKGFQAM